MERFKASEKELKTKAFSKEGLIAASRLDPEQKAKLELSQWISGQVDELARQVETTEAEIEQLAGGTKKKKGGASNERAAQLDQLNDRRKWHSSRLEILLRMLENGTLETDQVSDIKEDISYFVESNADEDFEEDEGIYDEFNLDEEEEAFGLKENEDLNNQDAASIPEGEWDWKCKIYEYRSELNNNMPLYTQTHPHLPKHLSRSPRKRGGSLKRQKWKKRHPKRSVFWLVDWLQRHRERLQIVNQLSRMSRQFLL